MRTTHVSTPTPAPAPADHGGLRSCIAACLECHAICTQMLFQHCLRLGGKHAEARHVTLMTDCAQICQVAADFMQRGSSRHVLVCRICAEICTDCAEDCERVGDMDACVQACRRCAQECQAMAA